MALAMIDREVFPPLRSMGSDHEGRRREAIQPRRTPAKPLLGQVKVLLRRRIDR